MLADLVVSQLPAKNETVNAGSGGRFSLDVPILPGTCQVTLASVDATAPPPPSTANPPHFMISRSNLSHTNEGKMDKLAKAVAEVRLTLRAPAAGKGAPTGPQEEQKAQQLKAMLQEVMAASKGGKEPAKPAPVGSDIDKIEIAEAQRVMGDHDLAVIIGIEGYQNLPKSDYAYDDARLVKEYAKALGFRERNIELLLDEKATKTNIEKSLEAWLRNKVKPQSRVLVYYSGHGAPDPATGEAYLVPYDGDPNYLAITGYPLKRLYAYLGQLGAGEAVLVLDACFSGTGGRSVLAKGPDPWWP
jgi:hypothetical protein